MTEPARILIVKLSSIGDVVMSLPVAAALRRRFPEAYLAWAVEPAAADVLAGNPHLDDVLIVGGHDRPSLPQGSTSLPPLSSPAGLRKALRSYRFQTSLDLQGLLKSAAVAYLSGARDRIGFRSRREGTFLLNNRRIVADRRDVHAVESYLDFAEALGAPREPVEFPMAIPDGDRRAVDSLIGDRTELAALIPGARWESKLWPAERFGAVASALAEESGLTSVVVGGQGDADLARRIAAVAPASVLDLTGQTTLKQAAEVFRRCRLTVGNDTGPLYLSAAMGTPTVAIFGPSDARRLGPYGPGHAKVVARISCAPCRNRRCAPRRCMELIEAAEVIAAARRLLFSKGGGPR
ncbi:MAG: glycosyltransferase family 9 protein [Armatimonadota bacterium]